ncbi:MAG: ferredoxin [Candidatus Margulisbacteria bacterium]|nr:ferredoxin [Candidatus Margulisiibacteriota bacterium]
MQVSVDQSLCTGCGLCVELCPDVFAWGSEGKVDVMKHESDTCSIEDVADQCPVEAINV